MTIASVSPARLPRKTAASVSRTATAAPATASTSSVPPSRAPAAGRPAVRRRPAVVRGMPGAAAAVVSRRTINATRPAARRGCVVPRTARGGMRSRRLRQRRHLRGVLTRPDLQRQRPVPGAADLYAARPVPRCCDKNGNCQPGNTEQACGTGGHACVNCPGRRRPARTGSASPPARRRPAAMGVATPPGSVSRETEQACGTGGAPCVNCQAGQFCCSTPHATRSIAGPSAPAALTRAPTAAARSSRPVGRGPRTGSAAWAGWSASPAIQRRRSLRRGRGWQRGGCRTALHLYPRDLSERLLQRRSRRAWQLLGQPGAQCGIGGALCQLCDNSSVCNAQGQCVCSRSCPRCQTCNTGTGQCQPVVCPPPADQCHAAGSCDPGTGKCSNPTVAHGTPCSDGASNPLCINGQCCTAGHEVVHGGCFQVTQITNGACTGCSDACQTCGGSIDGSPNFLCANETTNGCQSQRNAECPVGQACQTQIETCLAPC